MSTRKPIYVFEGGGTNPHVIATIDTDKFSDHDSKAETAVISRKVNNISTIELTIPTNCEASKAITNTSDLVLFDTKGDIQEFHITDVDDLDEYSVSRTIYAEQSFGELINNIVTSETPMPTTTNPSDYLAYILYFTRWSVGTVESGIYNSKWEENITGLTCLEAFQKLVDKYNCEFVIRYETDGKNKIIGRYVDLKKKIGSNLGKRFEDSKDIIGLKRTLDLDSVKTAIYPRIKLDSQDENGNSKTTYIDISSVAWSVAKGDPVDKPIGQTIIVNPDADAMHKRYNTKTGNLMEKIMYAEWTGETAKDAEDLCRQAWSILKANGVLTPTIEVTASDLYRMSGNNPDYSHEQVSLGDTCIIIDKNFEPELRLTTRVMEIEEDILNPVNNTYVFGNYRKTLATSNIESQKSIEEQLGQLQDKIQGITIPEYSLPYQSGKDYYSDVKAQIQNEFMSSSGYVMAQDSDGFWVFDAPIPDDREATYPTKATILKGGCVALAKYNPVTSTWEVGTFINGTTVNADYITAGHLNANVIAAGSITTKHLNTAAIEYIKTGMATDADLQGVVDSVASTYATKDSVSSNINNAVKDLVSTNDMNSAITSATKDLATKDSVSSNINNAVKDLVSTNDMNSAITNATKDMATNSSVNTAVKNATKDMATNTSVNSAINNATKDMATNSSVNTAIGNATSGLASKDYVNGAVSTITIGGRNIAIKTNQGTTGWGWSMKTGDAKASSFVDENGVDCCKLTRGNEAQTGWSVIWYTYINRIMYKTNTKYTVSFEVKSSVTSGNINCALRLSNSSGSIADSSGVNMGGIPTANTWIKLSCVLTTVSKFPTDTNQVLYLTGFNSNAGATYIFRNLKIEEGTKATAWTPAPEDIEEQNRLARINAIKDLQKQLQSEYNENIAKANKVYVDKYLPAGSTAKVNLNNKMTAYTTSYNNYNKYITTMIADGTVTEAEYTQYNTYATAYANAIKGLAEAIEDANSARLANVYAQARQGLVTTAELEVNNKSVIASAKAGMVSTGDMTSSITAATKDLVSNDALNNAIADFTTTSDVNSAITSATKDMATNSSVNSAVTNATKDMATNASVNSAINNATKDMATNSSVNNTVNNATKDMATNKGVTDAINGVTVGSRNLALLTSDDWVSFTGFKGGINDCRLKYKVLTSGLSVGDKLLIAFEYKLENMTYAASGTPIIRMQGFGDVTSWESGAFYGMFIPNIDKKPANAEGTAYVISTINSNHIKNTCWNCNFRTDYLAGGTVSIRRIRVVRSSKLIDWTAAPEDAYTTTVEETFKAITAEYNNNYKIATTLYLNTYLDGTAKTNLKAAYDDYKNKYNAVKGAHDAILFTGFGYAEGKSAWNTSLTNLQASTSTLGVRVQEASTYINTAIYNASKTYTDKAIPDALTGYAKTSYVDSAKADAIADAKKGMVSTSQLEVNNTEILLKSASMGQYNILRNTDFRDNMNYWKTWGTDAKETIKIVGETATTPGAAMSGEKNLVIMGADDATTGGKNIGFCQETNKCVVGVSYTVGYWVNCTGCSCVVQIESIDSKNTVSLLVKKSYQNINGGHDRATWKYDSLTFTVPKGSAKINFVVQLTYASAATHRVLLVKPMMTTGINAQAWTAHPDEIHVGVVSVTEQNGIKVEHSDFNTYTTLNAAGLKVYNKKDNSMIASFGESGSAYIGDLTCDGYVNAPQLMPMSKQLSGGIAVYCSETGSGNQSGNSSNYAMGWAGAMRVVLNYLGIDNTHTEGGFIVNSNIRSPKGMVISIYIKGTTFTNNIELYNVYGRVTFHIYFDAGCKFTGHMRFSNVESEINIDGNKTAVLQRGSSDDYAIQCYNVRLLYLHDIYVNYTKDGFSNQPIYAHHTHCYFSKVDFCNCRSMGIMEDGYLEAFNCQGSMFSYVSSGSRTFVNLTTETVPVVTAFAPYIDAYNTSTFTGTFKPTASVQKGASSVTINVTKTFNGGTYSSYRLYGFRSGVLLQGAPNAEELNKYGNYYGRIYFSSTDFAEAMNSINNAVVQLYLERTTSISIETDYVDVYIAGTRVGSLESDAGNWFTVPTSAIDSLKKGSNYIELNATGVDNYTSYKGNAVLKITGTQTF